MRKLPSLVPKVWNVGWQKMTQYKVHGAWLKGVSGLRVQSAIRGIVACQGWVSFRGSPDQGKARSRREWSGILGCAQRCPKEERDRRGWVPALGTLSWIDLR